LNQWVKDRSGDPLYRYGRQRRLPLDPTAQTEDLGDDAMRASALGIKNLKRIVPKIGEWSYEEGSDFDETKDLYQQVFNQFRRYIGHVTANIGGVVEISKTHDQASTVYNHVNKQTQKRAMDFLHQYVFNSPTWLVDQELARKFEPDGIVDRIKNLQARSLGILFNTDRLNRLIENESLNGNQAYAIVDLFEDTKEGIFNGNNDTYRRNLQRAFVDQLINIVESEDSDIDMSDIKAVARGTLINLNKEIKNVKKPKTIQDMHTIDLKERIMGMGKNSSSKK